MEIEQEVRFLKNQGLTYSEISKRILFDYGIDRSDDQLRYMNKRKFIPKLTVKEKFGKEGIEKVLIISDLHIPFNLDIVPILEQYRGQLTAIIIGGDLTDCAEISKFTSLGKCSLEREKIETYEMLSTIERMFPDTDIFIIKGNHEVRWERELANKGGVMTSFHSNNIIEEICTGFSIYDHEKKTKKKYKPLDKIKIIDKWYMQYKDVIICHPLDFSKIEGRTAANAVEHFVKAGFNFSACLVAHTHKQAGGWRFNKFFQEIGCLCKEQDYADSGKLSYTPCQQGYAIVQFTNGKFDYNNSKVVNCNVS